MTLDQSLDQISDGANVSRVAYAAVRLIRRIGESPTNTIDETRLGTHLLQIPEPRFAAQTGYRLAWKARQDETPRQLR